MDEQRLDDPLCVPGALSFLTHRRWEAEVKGLDNFPRDQWPDNIPLLYCCNHIMVGLGAVFLAVTALAVFLLWRRRLWTARWMLWLILATSPFPYGRGPCVVADRDGPGGGVFRLFVSLFSGQGPAGGGRS
ncbi:MAG TPA: cytochrome ubiquinol oxidase subunit I [Gemmataceae bacterium]|nr:cytochrome ubiquinol oxidase subunit I [Gemmataceae bacterium]